MLPSRWPRTCRTRTRPVDCVRDGLRLALRMTGSFSRAVSPLERLWIVADQMTPPFAAQLVVEGTGSLDVKAVQTAVRAVGDANPGTRLLLRRQFGRLRWVDGGVAPSVRVVDGRAWSGQDPEGADFLRYRLCPWRGPTAEVLLVEGAPTRLVFRMHHGVADGMGLLHWSHELFRALRGEPLVGATSRLTDHEAARRLGTGKRARRERSCLAPTGLSDWRAGSRDRGSTWLRKFVPGRHSQLIPNIALFIAGRAREAGPGRVHVHVPVDLRRYLPDEAPSTGNLSGMVPVLVEPDSSADQIEDLLRSLIETGRAADVVRQVAPAGRLPTWLMRLLGSAWAGRCHRRNGWSSSGSVSNLGMLSMEALSGGGFAAETSFSLPPPSFGTCLFLLLVGRPGGVELCASVPKPLATRGRLKDFLDGLCEDLAAKAREVEGPAG